MYAFEQDVPINAKVYAQIMDGLGAELPDGLLAHIAIERSDGHLSYLDVWESKADCEAFTDDRLHPVVGAALAQAGIQVAAEPPRREVSIVHAWGAGFAQRVAG